MATHLSILAWRTPWTEEPGGLQSMGSQRTGHDWVTNILSSVEQNSEDIAQQSSWWKLKLCLKFLLEKKTKKVLANPVDKGQVTSSWNHFLSTTQSSQDILWWGGVDTGYLGETPFHHSFNKVHTMWRVGKKSLCDPHHWKPLSSGPELKWLKSLPWREAPAGETDLKRKGNKLQAVPEERPLLAWGMPTGEGNILLRLQISQGFLEPMRAF